jgi:hypothetical protein
VTVINTKGIHHQDTKSTKEREARLERAIILGVLVMNISSSPRLRVPIVFGCKQRLPAFSLIVEYLIVIPAKAGIQSTNFAGRSVMQGPRLRGDDRLAARAP